MAVAHAGWLITAYALGVVAGATAIAVISARVARKRLVAGLLVWFAVAAALFLAPALQTRLIEVAPGAQLMGAAMNQSATNLANGIGATLGSLAIGHGLGYLSPAWVGVGLGAAGLALAAVSFRCDRRPAAAGRAPARAPVTRA